MSGICGWIGPSESPGAHSARFERMARTLTRYDASVSQSRSSDGAAVACASLHGSGDTWSDARRLVAIQGAFHWKDDEARREASVTGAARCISKLVDARGVAALDALAGAFALAIVDLAAGHVVLACDRMGVSSMCWYVDGDRVLFGSTVGAVLAAATVHPPMDPQCIHDYLYFSFVPAPETAWAGCRALRPAEWAQVSTAETRVSTYWRPSFFEDGSAAPATTVEVREAIRVSVSRGIRATGIGAFLSGGLDSSTMVGMLSQALPAPVRAYSLGYDIGASSELPYARIAARAFGAQHHECILTPPLLRDGMEAIAGAFASPFGNISAAALLLVTKTAASHGVTRMVAGDGGDELFAGNDHYRLQQRLMLWDRLPRLIRRRIVEPLLTRLPDSRGPRLVRRARGYVRRAAIPLPDRLWNYNAMFEAGASVVLARDFLHSVDPDAPFRQRREAWDAIPSRIPLNRMLATDWFYLLHGNDLPRAHRVCELAGQDVVFPMLGDDVVDVALRIPAARKLTWRQLRAFYIEAIRGFLPDATLNKKKQGENVPFGAWLQSDASLREFALDLLSTIRHRRIINPPFLDALLSREHLMSDTYPAWLAYLIVMLELWHRHHVDP